jgi:hypothetical protein
MICAPTFVRPTAAPILHTRNSILSFSVCLPCQRVNLSTGQLAPPRLVNQARRLVVVLSGPRVLRP